MILGVAEEIQPLIVTIEEQRRKVEATENENELLKSQLADALKARATDKDETERLEKELTQCKVVYDTMLKEKERMAEQNVDLELELEELRKKLDEQTFRANASKLKELETNPRRTEEFGTLIAELKAENERMLLSLKQDIATAKDTGDSATAVGALHSRKFAH